MERAKDLLEIRTPEHVGFQYVLAGIGTRIMAYCWDWTFRAVFVIFLLLMALLLLKWIPSLLPTGPSLGLSRGWVLGLLFLAYGIMDLGYFIIFEAMWSGQTPGKRIKKIRVIRANGQPMGWVESAVRNILRAVDLLFGVYPLGLLVMFFSERNQRIGDHAAGTVVVAESKRAIPSEHVTAATSAARLPVANLEYHVSTLSADEYRLLASFLDRRRSMDTASRTQLAATLAERLMARWQLDRSQVVPHEAFLEAVVKAYEATRNII